MSNKEHTSRFDTNNYSFNKDAKLGIYLIHGFSSTTYEVRKLAKYLANQGYQVRADNLPGHATTITNCNATSYKEWLSFTEQKIASMYSDCDKVIVIGVSMGAVLALHLGTIFPLEGIVAASAVFKFKNEFDVRVLIRLFHRFKKHIPKKSTFNPNQLKVLHNKFYGYTHYPLSAVNEMRKMVDKVQPQLSKISSPILLINSTIDQTAKFENHLIIKKSLTTKKVKTLILHNTGHNLFDTKSDEKKQIFVSVDNFIKDNFHV
tara:strand:+ start:131 stop:916 length:786 start_codon:yes stop_codon:yes gene_type:complete